MKIKLVSLFTCKKTIYTPEKRSIVLFKRSVIVLLFIIVVFIKKQLRKDFYCMGYVSVFSIGQTFEALRNQTKSQKNFGTPKN